MKKEENKFSAGIAKALEGVTKSDVRSKICRDYIDFMEVKAKAKAEELSAKLKKKVRYAMYATSQTEDIALAYYTAPITAFKLRIMDIISTGSVSRASVALFDATVIKNESDSRIFLKDEDNDLYYMAALDDVMKNWKKADIIQKKN